MDRAIREARAFPVELIQIYPTTSSRERGTSIYLDSSSILDPRFRGDGTIKEFRSNSTRTYSKRLERTCRAELEDRG